MGEKASTPKIRIAVSLPIAAATFILYLTRPDWAQAVHWWPMVFLTPIVIAPYFTLRPRAVLKPFGLTLLLWLVALHLVREPSVRVVLPHHDKAVSDFRIVSLNCAAGEIGAAKEAFSQGADIVLLQEVGSQPEFVAAAKAAGYEAASWSVDDAVFAHHISQPSKDRDFAAGTILLGGKRIQVVALRLMPPVFRLDLWNPNCWHTYADDARERRKRVGEIFERVPGTSLLAGGDFNATNPTLVTRIRSDMSEAGQSASCGWRGTGTNDFPLVWTDQIWGSADIRWIQSYVVKTKNSDHRMVVADFNVLGD